MQLGSTKVGSSKGGLGAVYLTESGRHKYSEFIKNIEGLKSITYPVCLHEDNNFDVIEKHLKSLKEVHGLIYVNDNSRHSFFEVQKAAEKLSMLNHPVLNRENVKSQFNQVVAAAEKLTTILGPVYLTEALGHHFAEFV